MSLLAPPYVTVTPFATMTFYASGTLNLLAVYSDGALTTPLTNPVVADSAGRFAPIFLGAGPYRIIVRDYTQRTIRDIDPVTSTGGGSSLTSDDISYQAAGGTERTLTERLGDWPSVKDYGATGNGTTNDTAAIASAETLLPTLSGLNFPAGNYLTGGNTFDKAASLFGYGAQLKASADNQITLTMPGDASAPEDSSRLYGVYGLDFNGNGADFYTFRPGSVGIKLGSTSYSPLHSVLQDTRFHGFEVGEWWYGPQQCETRHSKDYRNKCGILVQGDPVNGGGTATTFYTGTSQLNWIGLMLDNVAKRNAATTATLTNSSTAVTIADATDWVVGGQVTARGVVPGTTVTAIAGTTITLSAATTSTAAGVKVPILFRGSATGLGGPGYGMGLTFSGLTLQANGTAIAAWGIDSLTFVDPHLETNDQPFFVTSTTITRSARTIPKVPMYFNGCGVRFQGGSFNENASPMMRAEAGSRVEFVDITPTSSIAGDQTSQIAYYGRFTNLVGRVDPPVVKWPDEFTVAAASGWAAAGDPIQIRSKAVANAYTGNCRAPTLNASGGATASIVNDSRMGRCSKAVFPASIGGYGGISVNTDYFGGTVAIGDILLMSVVICADTYTTMQFRATAGGTSYGTFTVQVAPFPQRYVIALRSYTADASGVQLFMYPTQADGPTFYFKNMMQARGRAGDPGLTAELNSVLREGLFNDSTQDGTLTGTGTFNPGSIAAGATATGTVTVNGALASDVAMILPAASLGKLVLNVFPGAGVVNYEVANNTAGAIVPASQTFSARVITP